MGSGRGRRGPRGLSARPAGRMPSSGPDRGAGRNFRMTWRLQREHGSQECEGRLYPDRAPGGDRDHRRLDRAALAGGAGRPRGREARPMHQQPQADRPGDAQLREHLREPPARRLAAPRARQEPRRPGRAAGQCRVVPLPDPPFHGAGERLQPGEHQHVDVQHGELPARGGRVGRRPFGAELGLLDGDQRVPLPVVARSGDDQLL